MRQKHNAHVFALATYRGLRLLYVRYLPVCHELCDLSYYGSIQRLAVHQTLLYVHTARVAILRVSMEMQSFLRILVDHICDTYCWDDLQ